MKTLILVDIQNDFLPGGALAVPRGDEVVPVANRLMQSGQFGLIVATQDWHPADHLSFASQHAGRRVGEVIQLNGRPQVLWPDHCVQGTRGAELAPGLDTARIDHVTRKGEDRGIDSYSGFFDDGHLKATDLHAFLQARGATELFLVGLATDYCVQATALDARQLGYATTVIVEGIRGIELKPGDCERALAAMRAVGTVLVNSDPVQ